MRDLLLAWYAATGRDLPWRRTRDPYAILVSEVMLQQTQVDRVVPRYERWLERWPTVDALAAATTADVILEWQGLGYNRRAVSLHRAARVVAERGWPDDLTELPGVGPYTAAAVGNFAFGRDVLPGRHERPPRAGAHRRELRRRVRAGAVRPRRDRLPRARAALRRVPARRAAARRAAGATSRCGSSRRSRARSGSAARVALRRSPPASSPDDAEAVASLARDGLVTLAGGVVVAAGLAGARAAPRPARRGPRRGR